VDHARVAVTASVDHALAFTRVVIGPGVRAVLVVVLASKILCQRNILCDRDVGAAKLQL
jgi:hypothetical protein